LSTENEYDAIRYARYEIIIAYFQEIHFYQKCIPDKNGIPGSTQEISISFLCTLHIRMNFSTQSNLEFYTSFTYIVGWMGDYNIHMSMLAGTYTLYIDK
jgi:hypothetical protein